MSDDKDLAGEAEATPYLKSRPLEEGEWSDVVVIRPNGRYDSLNCEPTLKNLQTLVGGYIEVIPGFTKFGTIPAIVIGDEEGRIRNKPYNNRATVECAKCMNNSGHQLFGDIVVLTGKAKKEFERD